ncbi:glycosyltransferase [Dermabacteraceae bacterium P7074]
MSEPFSVLLPLWRGDDPAHFRAAYHSATSAQELKPAQVVISVDGELTPALEQALAEVAGDAVVVRGDTHGGLAKTLARGLAACEHEIVARCDADDLCHPQRFAKQIPYLRENLLDLLGCAMRELRENAAGEYAPGSLRTRPSEAGEIACYARSHNPFQHPTVVFRRSAVEAAGGYLDLPLLEDYWLWVRMLTSGAKVANLPDALVDYRVSRALYRRRGGLKLLRSDITFQRRLIACGFVGPLTAARNLALRTTYRLVPARVRDVAYHALVERSGRTKNKSK